MCSQCTENKIDLSESQINVILAEYVALREELMYFLTQQRNKMNLLATTSFGQVAALVLSGSRLGSLDVISVDVLIVLYLFVFPLLIFFLFSGALENTIRVILLADYIHKGIKPQLSAFMGDREYFEWEEHKGRTSRVSTTFFTLMDYSKWFIFIAGILVSYWCALWLADNQENIAGLKILFVTSALMDCVLLVVCVSSAIRFNESEGESKFSIDSRDIST